MNYLVGVVHNHVGEPIATQVAHQIEIRPRRNHNPVRLRLLNIAQNLGELGLVYAKGRGSAGGIGKGQVDIAALLLIEFKESLRTRGAASGLPWTTNKMESHAGF